MVDLKCFGGSNICRTFFCPSRTTRGMTVNHGPIAQHWQIEAVAVERDELRARSTAGLVPKKRTPALVGAGVIRRMG